MGAGSSLRSARRVLRGRLCSLCPSRRSPAAATAAAAAAVKGVEAGGAAGVAAPSQDAVIVMPLDNPPDVIGAHERYYSPGGYPYCLGRTRTLPTQHQHPPQPPPQRPEHAAADPSRKTSSRSEARSRSPAASGTHHPQHGRRRRHHHRGRSSKPTSSRCSRPSSRPSSRPQPQRLSRACFGYDIEDVDGFLAKASMQSPANIPMVLATACTLYRTREGGWQEEVSLPLGMVLNGVFRAAGWLYAQTPHGHEGYVRYTSCLPLGIIPQQQRVQVRAATATTPSPSSQRSSRRLRRPGPCWDTASDIFPYPALCSGNRTDTDKMRDTRSERAYSSRSSRRPCRWGLNLEGLLEARRAEKRVDALYIQACAGPGPGPGPSPPASSRPRPGTLVVVQRTYNGFGLSLARGDVVAILENEDSGLLRVQDRHGREGLVPASLTDSGYL
ncbi:Zinc finger CCCH domain-containing protein 40 [Frankliniella fusca]|uniref:Zinc finger CCCH domain-containing protein 40 n=1 Tax=Frankliniella fusca TaxID=407009 RepID=A0AAE1HPF4_9NEOP|nr:Zinc finger CCCH domain-containing protein 40 [Frankliniella fusca]